MSLIPPAGQIPPGASSTNLSELIRAAGFTGRAAEIMYAIVMAESGGSTYAHNTNSATGDNSYGLAQINMLGSMGSARLREWGLGSIEELFDPFINLRAAYMLSNHGTNFSPWTTYTRGTYQQFLGQHDAHVGMTRGEGASGGSGGGGGGGSYSPMSGGSGGSSGGGLTREDLASIDGLGKLLDSIPELKSLVDQALAGGWTTTKFQNEVEDSAWWKSNSATARSIIIAKANDPATYNENFNTTVANLLKLGNRLGMRLSHVTAEKIATNALLTGNAGNEAWLTDRIAGYHDYSHYGGVNPLSGELGATYTQLRELASAYGQNPGDAYLAERAKHILQGATTLDAAKAYFVDTAKSIFPGLSDQLDAGQTVAGIADPYVQTMANLLEVDPATLGIMSTPLVRRALQGTSGTGKGTIPQVTPLWQFEQQVRQDPTWSFTRNAHKDMATLALQLGRTWGFG